MGNEQSVDKNIIPRSAILIIDSNERIRKGYAEVLLEEEHIVFEAPSWDEAKPLIAEKNIDLVLLAYSLPDAKAEDVVREIKQVRSRIRIILLFSKNENVSRRKLLRTLPIQGCHEKRASVDRLLVWIDVVLKNLTKLDMIREQLGTIKSQVKIIEKNKEGLRYIINAMPETINRLQPLDKFIRGILIQLNGFIEADNSFLATINENDKLILLAGTGEYDMEEKKFLIAENLATHMEKIDTARRTREIVQEDYGIYFPLCAKDKVMGIFYLEKNRDDLEKMGIDMLRLFASQTAITIDNSNLFKLATVDGLTGLYVRRYFLQRFQEVLQFSSRYGGQAISLLLFDIDHFKDINDTFGHPEGDKVLSHVSQIIRDGIRTTDVTGRLGGEEFVVLLIDTDLDKTKQLAETIRRRIEECDFVINNKRHPVTISVGISHFSSYSIETAIMKTKTISAVTMHDVRRMLSAADKALYASKEGGRNRSTTSDPLTPETPSDE
ncbi:MAG: diguanylate cyclase [Candidatus Omnitrophica bacterium]|nr:diguanylate cyclase [Candidatus Omnitrophota bacterium]